jgi:hypothetical protein
MASAMRSFTLQHGCISSILHTTSAKHMSVTFLSRKSGVLPITSVASRRMSGGECAVALGEAWARGWWRANRAAGCDFGAAAPCAKAALGGLCALGPIVRCIISGEESNPGNFATGLRWPMCVCQRSSRAAPIYKIQDKAPFKAPRPCRDEKSLLNCSPQFSESECRLRFGTNSVVFFAAPGFAARIAAAPASPGVRGATRSRPLTRSSEAF